MLLHTNESFHGNVDTRREQFQQYYSLFDNVKEMTQLWFETQNKWIFLRSALANLHSTNDENDFLKGILLKFNDVDENFRVISFCSQPNHSLVLFIEFSKISLSKSIRCRFS